MKTLFLDDKKQSEEAVDLVRQKQMIVMCYWTTYGTAFWPDEPTRLKVAAARGEDLNKLESVSLVGSQKLKEWVDRDRLHPEVGEKLDELMNAMENIAFVRFPAKERVVKEVGPHFANAQGEIQVFFTHDQEPLTKGLREKYDQHFYAVRSGNFHGLPEQISWEEAVSFAAQAGAAAVVAPSAQIIAFEKSGAKKRIGSQPSVRLMVGENRVEVVRQGSTHEETMRRLIGGLGGKFAVEYREEKPPKFVRPAVKVDPRMKDVTKMRRKLFELSGIWNI